MKEEEYFYLLTLQMTVQVFIKEQMTVRCFYRMGIAPDTSRQDGTSHTPGKHDTKYFIKEQFQSL